MRRLSFFILIICCIAQIVSATVSPPREGKDHLWWAERLLSEIDDTSTAYVYQRNARGIAWKGYASDSSYAFTDCSGFLNGLFEHVYGYHRSDLRRWLGADARKSGPTANRYYAAIAEQRGFARIERIQDVRPGDILAILYPEDLSNTGHSMIVADLPEKADAVSSGTDMMQQWKVTVIDSSASPHGRQDTRWRDGNKHRTGLGKGSVRLYVNAAGEVIGYSWSFGPKSKFYPAAERPIAVGRLTSPASSP
jgi:hypothetical protein